MLTAGLCILKVLTAYLQDNVHWPGDSVTTVHSAEMSINYRYSIYIYHDKTIRLSRCYLCVHAFMCVLAGYLDSMRCPGDLLVSVHSAVHEVCKTDALLCMLCVC